MTISENTKSLVADRLSNYVERMGSQTKAANALKISTATVSQVLNKNWDLISDEMWRSIASHIRVSSDTWATVETRDYKMLTQLLEDAQANSNVFAITGEAGTGKSHTVRLYADTHKRVYLIQCAEYWNRKIFLQELLTTMGRDYSGLNVNDMMNEVVKHLKAQDRPLVILDEADKLADPALYFFITLYNRLEDHCGIILLATDHLSKRIMHGLRKNRKGYKEIFSRIARRFIELLGPSTSDIMSICMANGIQEKDDIRKVIEDSDSDLRRVHRRIHALTAAL
jgi:DNA transposition AAA+ family ATPase